MEGVAELHKRDRLEIILNLDRKQWKVIWKLTCTTTMWAKLNDLHEPQDKLHTLAILSNMCVTIRKHLINLGGSHGWCNYHENCILEDIKIGLVVSNLSEYWGIFIPIHGALQHCVSYLLKYAKTTFNERRRAMIH